MGLGEEEDAAVHTKYVIQKDPNANVLRLYQVPLATFSDEDEAGAFEAQAGGEEGESA